jgi:hypothetical protein
VESLSIQGSTSEIEVGDECEVTSSVRGLQCYDTTYLGPTLKGFVRVLMKQDDLFGCNVRNGGSPDNRSEQEVLWVQDDSES